MSNSRMTRQILHFRRLLCLAVALVVVAAGCGSKGGSITLVKNDQAEVGNVNIDDSATSSTPEGTGGAEGGETAGGGTSDDESTCPPVGGTSERVTKFESAPPICIDVAKSYAATVVTTLGTFVLALDSERAPKTVNNFVVLSRYHYYDNIIFHRVVENFVIQAGDPFGVGTGGPGYSFADELPQQGEYEMYSLAMANSGRDSNGSQFFIVTGDDGVDLPPLYSLFGKVTAGFAVIDEIQSVLVDGGDKPAKDIAIESVTISES